MEERDRIDDEDLLTVRFALVAQEQAKEGGSQELGGMEGYFEVSLFGPPVLHGERQWGLFKVSRAWSQFLPKQRTMNNAM